MWNYERSNREEEDVLLQFPFTIIERAYVPCFEPAGDAVEVECVLFVCLVGGGCIGVGVGREEDWGRTLQIPHAALHSSLVADTWFAWQSMPTP
jgi:hypothetical protein